MTADIRALLSGHVFEVLRRDVGPWQEVVDLVDGNPATSTGLESLPVLTSPDNKAQCVPSVWLPEKSLVELDAQGASGYLVQAQMEARLYQKPFAEIMLAHTSGPLTSLELRGWTGWFTGLREFRSLMARLYAVRDGAADNSPAP